MSFYDFVVEYFGCPVNMDNLDEYDVYMLCKLYEERTK